MSVKLLEIVTSCFFLLLLINIALAYPLNIKDMILQAAISEDELSNTYSEPADLW